MRKFLLSVAFAAAVSGAVAQQDLKDVQEKISKGKYTEAKERLDKYLADPKNAKDVGAYYYKGVINKYFAQTDSTGTLSYDAGQEAFNSYKKALEIDPKNSYMLLDQNMGLFELFDLYYNRGIRQYNNKTYDGAFTAFKNAVDLQDYIRSKNFTLTSYSPPVLDTQLLNLTASSAYLAKKEDVSIPYFERIANAKVKNPEYKEVYAIVAQHYLKKNDQPNASKYIGLGKELYADDDYWLSLEFNTPALQEYSGQVDKLNTDANKATGAEKAELQKQLEAAQARYKDAKISRYETLLQSYPNNKALAVEYAIDLFNNTYVWDKKPADYTARQVKLQTALDKASALDQSSAITYFIESQHYYSQIFDLEDARRLIKGNTPAEAAKRKDYNTMIDKKYDDMMAASQKAFDIYAALPEPKQQDKTNYRKVTDQLIDYYNRKKMNDKVTFYQAKKAAIK